MSGKRIAISGYAADTAIPLAGTKVRTELNRTPLHLQHYKSTCFGSEAFTLGAKVMSTEYNTISIYNNFKIKYCIIHKFIIIKLLQRFLNG